MSVPQNYAALSTIWPSLAGSTLSQKLSLLNAIVVTPKVVDSNGVVLTPDIYWPQANGWQGPINQNDLVVASIITDDERKAWEDNPT